MAKAPPRESHRFVVVWRREPREIAGAALNWRGWVARVPDPRQRELSGEEEERIAVRSLDDVPKAMRTLIER